jgi:Flp pilus assembly protein TadG
MVFGVIEGGRLVWTMHTLTNATREGSRYALVRGSMSDDPATTESVRAHMLDTSSGLDPDELTVTLNYPDGNNDPKSRVRVSSSYQYTFIVGMVFGTGTITLDSVSEAIIAY